MKGKSMVSIGMAYCELGAEGAKAVAELVLVTPSITSLSLGYNELGDEGAIAITQALKESKVSKLASLDLSGKSYGKGRIGPTGAKELSEYLSVTASLTSVRSPAHQHTLMCSLPCFPSTLLVGFITAIALLLYAA